MILQSNVFASTKKIKIKAGINKPQKYNKPTLPQN